MIKAFFIAAFQPYKTIALLNKRIQALQMAESELAKEARKLYGASILLDVAADLHRDPLQQLRTHDENVELRRENMVLKNKLLALEKAHLRLCDAAAAHIRNAST